MTLAHIHGTLITALRELHCQRCTPPHPACSRAQPSSASLTVSTSCFFPQKSPSPACSLFGNEELSHRSEDTRSPLSSARDSDLGGHSTARAQVTSRLASYRSYVSQGESAQDDAATLGGGATTAKHQILRSLLALAPVTGEGHEDARATAEVRSPQLCRHLPAPPEPNMLKQNVPKPKKEAQAVLLFDSFPVQWLRLLSSLNQET